MLLIYAKIYIIISLRFIVPLYYLSLLSKYGDTYSFHGEPQAVILPAAVSKLWADQLTQWFNDLARLRLLMHVRFVSV